MTPEQLADLNAKRRVLGKSVICYYADLSEKHKETLRRSWTQDGSYLDYEWWDGTYDDFERVCEIIGVDLDNKSISFDLDPPNVQLRASYSYKAGFKKKLKAYAPLDAELARIADAIIEAQKENSYKLCAKISPYGRGGLLVEAVHSDYMHRPIEIGEQVLEGALNDLVEWLGSCLQKEHDWHYEDEQVDNSIESAGFLYDAEDGNSVLEEDLK